MARAHQPRQEGEFLPTHPGLQRTRPWRGMLKEEGAAQGPRCIWGPGPGPGRGQPMGPARGGKASKAGNPMINKTTFPSR